MHSQIEADNSDQSRSSNEESTVTLLLSTTLGKYDYRLHMPWVCNLDAQPMTYSSSLGSKMVQQSPIGLAKLKHNASLCTCHRKRLDLFFEIQVWPTCVWFVLLFLYDPLIPLITSRILYHRLFVSEISFLLKRAEENLQIFGGLGGLIPTILVINYFVYFNFLIMNKLDIPQILFSARPSKCQLYFSLSIITL